MESVNALHVGHVLSTFELGGMERVALDLAVGLRERGGRASVIAFAPEGPIEREMRAANVPCFALSRQHRGYDVRLMLRLRQLLREQKINVVHTHNRLAMVYGAVAGRLAHCGVVHTKHGLNPASLRQRVLRRATGELVDHFVAVSTTTASDALSDKEVDARRLSVIPNGIDLRRFTLSPEARTAVRKELAIGEGALVIGTVGRLSPEKDQATLIRAAEPLLGEQSRLLLVGDGPEAERLRALASALPHGRFVHFLGERSDVPRVLGAMDLFVLSSITEGLPLAILEAMAAGLPILATPVGGIPEVVRTRVSGYMFPVGQAGALRTLLDAMRRDRAEIRRMGDEARRAAQTLYSRDTAVERYVATYESARRARL
jgi:glycosyltransferase involved in cell wall biosynthesis